MKRGLHQADSGEIARCRPLQHCLHELPAYSRILDGRIDGNGPNSRNGIPLVKTIAADDPSIPFSHYAIKTRMRKRAPQDVRTHAGRRNVGWKIVIRADFVEGIIADLPTDLCIFRLRCSDDHTVRQFTNQRE